MRILRALIVLACIQPCALSAYAQAPAAPANVPEKVIVTAPAQIPEAAVHDFIKSYTASSEPSGKVARWRYGACPITTGLPPAGNKLVTDRVLQIAAMVGAPAGHADCKPNIDIVFTFNPQVLMDKIREKNRVLLGYHHAAEETALATITHPVQAWYLTQTVDQTGNAYLDKDQSLSAGYTVGSVGGPVTLSDAPAVHVTGFRFHDELSSELFHAVVVIDLSKVNGLELGSLSDYVAMLSLARTTAFEICQPITSITNLFGASCDTSVKTNEISAGDLAYLHGLYSIDPQASFQKQKDSIAYEMRKGASPR